MSSISGPGKLAPTLIEDLQIYDPRHPLATGLNVLRDTPLHLSHDSVAALLPVDSCRHTWCAKEKQNVLPTLDSRPAPESKYNFAGLCSKCRIHVDLIIGYSGGLEWEPCPNTGYPLHHFVHSPFQEQTTKNNGIMDSKTATGENLSFDCSSPRCGAALLVRLKLPILSTGHIRILTDRALLSQRAEEVIECQPARFEGCRKPSPVDVLSDLRTILMNVFEHGESRIIKADNKRFCLRFGINGLACRDVLELLRFTYESEDHWVPPRANHIDSAPFDDHVNIFIDDVIAELSVLIAQMPEGDHRHTQESMQLPEAGISLFRLLGAQNYEKHLSSRARVSDPATREICYTALGVTQDAGDGIVSFAYLRQKTTNPGEGPMYLSHLRQIAEDRRSEVLLTLLAKEYSTGNLDAGQVIDAYRYFSLSPQDQAIDDEVVLGNFQARLQDSAKHEAEMRIHLKVIGEHRHSKRIIDAAEDALNNYEQALSYFDAEPSVADEFIPTLYTTKTTEDPTTRQRARRAVELIAQTRSSAALYSWLKTGELGDASMDIGEAYRLLGVQDRTIDETIIETAYKMAVEDVPQQSEAYTKAFNAILADRSNSQLQPVSRDTRFLPDLARPDWPVGLENIGNTCYLNSLLQFLFTIPQLRNLVLNFEDARMDITRENVSRKKVGSRQIIAREIERAQRFVLKLRELFLEMIRSPYQYVVPDQELTRLTLMTTTAAENIRRRSTIGGSRPLGTVNGLPLQGPLGPKSGDDDNDSKDQPMLSPSDDSTAARDQGMQFANLTGVGSSEPASSLPPPVIDKDGSGDNSSEVTLVSTPSLDGSAMVDGGVKSGHQALSSDGGYSSPLTAPDDQNNDTVMTEKSDEMSSASIRGANATKNEHMNTSADGNKVPQSLADPISSEPPSRPPPQPPRPVPAAPPPNPTLEEYARQQDVTEVLNHVLFQLSCAIKPTGFEEGGEQIDQIKEMFYGRTRQHIMSESEEEARSDTFCSIIVRLYSQPHDIYAALDGFFDVEEIANKKRFLSMSRLPPIFQVQIDRASAQLRKVNHHVELKETIYLDRYLEEETNSALMERRQEAWVWKRELAELEARQAELTADRSHPDAQTAFHDARLALMHLQEVSTRIEGLEVPPAAIATLESLAEQIRLELQGLSSRCKDLSTNITSQFADSGFRRHAYRLHAAFFHHGTASSGHYWIYIYDFRKEMWLKYNDTRVEEVRDTNEIFRRPSDAEFEQWNGPSNPYYLVYVRDEDKDRLVESVCRDIQIPAGPRDDADMSDETGPGPEMTEIPKPSYNGLQPPAQGIDSESVHLTLRERSGSSAEWNDAESRIGVKW